MEKIGLINTKHPSILKTKVRSIAIIVSSGRLLLLVRSMTWTSRSRPMPSRSTPRSLSSMGPFSFAVSRFFGPTARLSISIAISVPVSTFSMWRVSSTRRSHVGHHWRCHGWWGTHRWRSCQLFQFGRLPTWRRFSAFKIKRSLYI